MATHTLIGISDTYGIERIHPRREGRSETQIGKKGISNKRWMVGGKLCFVLNHIGLITDWAVDTANVYDGTAFQDFAERNAEKMVCQRQFEMPKVDEEKVSSRHIRLASLLLTEWPFRMDILPQHCVPTCVAILLYFPQNDHPIPHVRR